MTAAASRSLSLRTAAAVAKLSLVSTSTFASASRVFFSTGFRSSPSTEPMLGRANKDYAARSAATASATGTAQKSKLEQTLFPSSSPRDGCITDYCKNPTGLSTAPSGPSALSSRLRPSFNSVNSQPAASASALGFRSPNIAIQSSFASLCSKPDSFKDNTPAPNPKIKQAGEDDLLAYGIDLDDFTDDENLGLDLSPETLPVKHDPLPSANGTKSVAPVTTAATGQKTEIPPSSGSIGSWPPSSPSHLLPPSAASSKRSAQDVVAPFPALPAAKKRAMPKHWSQPRPESHAPYSTDALANKHADSLPWNATSSALDAQKKRLKDYTKKAVLEDAELVRDDGFEGQSGITPAAIRAVATPTKISLSSEQQSVKNLVCFKHASVFFTGPAGTGKSVLMRAIIQELRKKYKRDPECLGVTASTGLAACNIGGMTLHSFSGIGLGKEDVQTLVRKIRRNPKAKQRWQKVKTLVIDEISMVDGDLFDKLSQIGRTIRNNGRPWGGIQLVLTGDFFQLPPVPDREKRDVKFAFEAATWNTSIDHTIGLTEVFRQKDPEFAEMLNEMRLGRISDKTVQTFKSLTRPLQSDDGLEVTELFPTRNEVDNSNEKRLRALKGKPHRYEAADTGEPAIKDKLLQNMMAPKSLVLREGAQVMLIKNMDETLVNGSVGKVIKFMTEAEFEQFGDGDMGSVDPAIKKRAALFNQYLHGGGGGSSDGQVYPFVRFHAADGSQRGILVRQEEWKVELPTGEVQASRHQLPLILAWALSIHKAQGQTLERVKVDLGRVFEKGQAYVALSRATTKTGLQVLRFEKHKVMAHPRVIGFYSKLYSAGSAMKSTGGNSSILAFTRKTELMVDSEPPSFARSSGAA